MFERVKREDGSDEQTEARPVQAHRSYDAASVTTADRKGDCAVIGRSIQIEGAVRGNEDLRIEGDVSGTVEFRDSSLTIGKEGRVRADVYAKSIVVDGMTEGDLYATDRIVVHVNAQVRGNITAPKVGVEEGAKFKGSIDMDEDAVEKAFDKANLKPGTPTAGNRQQGKSDAFKSTPKPDSKDKDTGPAVSPAAGVK